MHSQYKCISFYLSVFIFFREYVKNKIKIEKKDEKKEDKKEEKRVSYFQLVLISEK